MKIEKPLSSIKSSMYKENRPNRPDAVNDREWCPLVSNKRLVVIIVVHLHTNLADRPLKMVKDNIDKKTSCSLH